MHSTNLVCFYPTPVNSSDSARPNFDFLTASNGACTKINMALFGPLRPARAAFRLFYLMLWICSGIGSDFTRNISIESVSNECWTENLPDKAYMWNYFVDIFDDDNPCTYHYLCPCSKFHECPPPANFHTL